MENFLEHNFGFLKTPDPQKNESKVGYIRREESFSEFKGPGITTNQLLCVLLQTANSSYFQKSSRENLSHMTYKAITRS